VVFVGLCVGSFLNVVIYRLPIMLEREWKNQCQDFLDLKPATDDVNLKKFNLNKPRSSCPNCGHMITAWENIPVLSYLLLKGKCSSCNNAISFRYPTVEIITALLSLAVVVRFGLSYEALSALVFTWTLIALTLIDFDTQLLPDNITIPLLWLGILISIFQLFTDLQSSVIGAMFGYLILWTVFHLFKAVTGKEGMGYGDFKLLAALGAWMGWQDLPTIILLSSITGAIIGLILVFIKRTNAQQPIPFGPFLAIAGWITLMWGNEISQLYLTTLS